MAVRSGPAIAIKHRTGILNSGVPFLLGVINVTPDSFSDGGTYLDTAAAVDRAAALVAAGADLIDVGGESTRPGADPVSPEEELARVIPVVERIAGRTDRPISIDTRRARVAREALAAGASVINDVSGLDDPAMARVAADTGAALIIGHIRGTPQDMQDDPRYDDVVAEVRSELAERVATARRAGVAESALMVDPGIGFGKTVEHNLQLLARLDEIVDVAPVCIGVSRKSFIGKIADVDDPARRGPGSLAAAVLAVERGAAMVRTHDVADTRQALTIAASILRHGSARSAPAEAES